MTEIYLHFPMRVFTYRVAHAIMREIHELVTALHEHRQSQAVALVALLLILVQRPVLRERLCKLQALLPPILGHLPSGTTSETTMQQVSARGKCVCAYGCVSR